MFTIQTTSLSRVEALRRIRLLSGKDLRPLAEQYGVTVWKKARALFLAHILNLQKLAWMPKVVFKPEA